MSLQSVNWFAVQGPDKPSSSEFLEHPDYRQIAAFFLGWVFFYSLLSIFQSPLLAGPILHLTSLSRAQTPLLDPEGQIPPEKEGRTLGQSGTAVGPPPTSPRANDNPILGFTLFLSMMFASLGLLISLLPFNSSSGGTACAFFTAWGFVTAKSVLLLGLLILSFDLRQLGISRAEAFTVWAFLGIALALVFATAAVATGFLSIVRPIGFALCSRKYFIPTSLGASIVFFFLELYVVVRLYTRLGSLRDVRIFQVLSLVVFTLLTAVPDAIPVNTLTQFIPLALASCLVLAAFNCPTSGRAATSQVSNGALAPMHALHGRHNVVPQSIPPAVPPPPPAREEVVPSTPNVEVIPPSERELQRSIPPPLPLEQPSYVVGPLRDEYGAFRSPMSKSPMPQTARTNWTNETPMLGAFPSSVLRMASTQHVSLAQHHTPMAVRAERVMSSVPMISDGVWQHSVAPPVFSPPTRIVPSQAEFAQQLEAADAHRAAITPTGPTMRPHRPRVNIGSPAALSSADDRPKSTGVGPRDEDSAIYGSDIILPTPSKRRKDKTRRHSSWAVSIAPTIDVSEPESSPDKMISRKSISSNTLSAFRSHCATRSVDTVPELPSPPFPPYPPVLPPLEPTAPLRINSRIPSQTGGLPSEIARMAVQPLRIPPKASSAARTPRPLPVSPPAMLPPAWDRAQVRSANGNAFTQGPLFVSPEGSPVRENWQEVGVR